MKLTTEDINSVKQAVLDVSPMFDIERVYLFGSFVRNQQNETSDIDLCLETGNKFSLLNAINFSDKIQTMTGRKVDVITERSLYPHVRKSMLEERKLLYERV